MTDDSRRIKANEELDELIKRKNILTKIKSRRTAWFGHVESMVVHWLTKKIMKWKPIALTLRGKSNIKWKDDAKQALKEKSS